MQYFDIVELRPGQKHQYQRQGKKERLIVGRGKCRIAAAGQEMEAQEKAILDLGPQEGAFAVLAVEEDCTLIRLCGDWGQECGGAGLFRMDNSEKPQDKGDPVEYEKTTNFDAHYHDCDEYWIIYEGQCTAVSEGKMYEVGPGDCLATGMGHHHDIPRVAQPVRGAYFETTLEGQKRRGHLWDHTHGRAQPRMERV
jgi:mannose-6-phosphate isomerase-like protein (cupin superfamily)